MTALQQKQFIVAFLLLAIVGGSSAFMFSGIGSAPAQTSHETTSTAPTGAQNAFVEKLPGDLAGLQPDVTGASADTDPANTITDPSGNLTEQLVALLGQSIDQANPGGPIGSNGQPELLPPDVDQIVAQLRSNISIARTIPDWEGDIVFHYKPVLVAGNNPKNVAAYRDAKDRVLGTYFGFDQSAPGAFTQEIDPKTIQTQIALDALQRIPVPDTLTAYHLSLYKALAYQEKVTDLIDMSTSDPLRASLIMRVQEANYFGAAARYGIESKKAIALGLLPTEDIQQVSVLADMLNVAFGVRTAHAQWVVTNLPQLAQSIWQYVQQILTEKLKEFLVHKLVTQTITWIQGGGKPQFITDWKGFLKDSGKFAVDRTLSDLYPQLCQPFAPLIRIAVLPTDQQLESPISCSLDQIVGNVKAFAGSFANGGWIAYGAALQPSNNFFGALIQTNDIVQSRIEAERKAKENAAKAGKGGRAQQECVEYAPQSAYEDCADKTNALCADERLTVAECNDEIRFMCAGLTQDTACREYRDTTPGGVILNSLNDAVRAPLERIVNADDFVALVNALINAMLSKLTALGKDAISKGVLGLNPDEPYVGPGDTDNTDTRQPPVVPGYPPVTPPGTPTSTPPGGGGAIPVTYCAPNAESCYANTGSSHCVDSRYQSEMSAALNEIIAADRASGGGIFNFNDMNGSDPAIVNTAGFFAALVRNLQSKGFLAVGNLAAQDEIAIRKSADTFDEYYDVIRDVNGKRYVRGAFHAGMCSPPGDT